MKDILIIGYGNSLAGDDAFGYYVIQHLLKTGIDVNIEIKYVHQLMPEHAAEISDYDTVIFIDAAEGTEAGKINCSIITESDLHDTSMTSHEYTLDSILLLAKRLYGKIPVVYLITVTGQNFLMGEMLSPVVESKIPDVMEMINKVKDNELQKELNCYA